MYLFILGRQPEIGLAELRAVFGRVELILPHVALVSTDETPGIDRLGSVRKVGRVIYDADGQPGEFLIDKFSALPPGKITLGISHYGQSVSIVTASKTAKFIKSKLHRSMRILPNSGPEIADAATLGNHLGSSPNKVELLMAYVGHCLIIAELIGVQDLNSYTLRDRGRPKRDAHVGMLPPKLAQIMINLAVGVSSNPGLTSNRSAKLGNDALKSIDPDRAVWVTRGGAAPKNVLFVEQKFLGADRAAGPKHPEDEMDFSPSLLDPFCGTGVVLQEAALMGFRVHGTDLEPRMIEYTTANLDWLKKQNVTKHLSWRAPELAVGDATNFKWVQWLDKVTHEINLIVTETYLGQPYTTPPPTEKLQENITTCNTIISKFLINLATQITPDARLCIAVPCWFLNDKTYHLPLTHQLSAGSYEQIFYSDDQKPLIYRREDQIVGRELLVLRKKP
ncbi:hypothetical protein FWH58_03905 [Candidatus Saccharibacteria bacterium]|nr:hypothetical protein [Candidatus Saccharibacteria bacterium]